MNGKRISRRSEYISSKLQKKSFIASNFLVIKNNFFCKMYTFIKIQTYNKATIKEEIMSGQTTSVWINHDLYNEFPSVEYARNSITVEQQITIGKMLAVSIPELIGQFGTTLTHGHHGLNQKEAIIGYVDNRSLLSKPKERTDTVCPTTWVVEPNGLSATEGVDNASVEVFELAKTVEKCAGRILQHVPRESDERFSKLSITIDPRKICKTDCTYFVETNDREISILTPKGKKELQASGKKVIPTYKSIDSPQFDRRSSTETWCSSDCLPYKGSHYYSHMKE